MAPFCWLMALALAEDAFAPPWINNRFTIHDSRFTNVWRRLGVPLVGLAVAAGLIGYPLAATLVYKHRPKIKNIAEAVNAVVPPNEILYAVDPRYQPFFFYAHSPVKYVLRLVDLPAETRYFVARPKTFGNWLLLRGFVPDGNPRSTADAIKRGLRIYSLASAAKPRVRVRPPWWSNGAWTTRHRRPLSRTASERSRSWPW